VRLWREALLLCSSLMSRCSSGDMVKKRMMSAGRSGRGKIGFGLIADSEVSGFRSAENMQDAAVMGATLKKRRRRPWQVHVGVDEQEFREKNLCEALVNAGSLQSVAGAIESCKVGKDVLDSAFLWATRNGHYEAMRILMEAEPSIKARCEALAAALDSGRSDTVGSVLQCLKNDCNNAIMQMKSQALQGFCRGSNWTMAEVFWDDWKLLRSLDLEETLPEILRCLVRSGQIDALVRLTNVREGEVDFSMGNNSLIRIAASNGQANIVDFLLEKENVDPRALDNFALCVAVENGHAEVARSLLADPRVNPAARNNFPIKAAASMGFSEVVDELLNTRRVNPDSEDQKALMEALKSSSSAVVQSLLNSPLVQPPKFEALDIAVQYSSKEIVQMLLQDGRVEPTPETLSIACEGRRDEITRLLVSRKSVQRTFSTIEAVPRSASILYEDMLDESLRTSSVVLSIMMANRVFVAIHFDYFIHILSLAFGNSLVLHFEDQQALVAAKRLIFKLISTERT